MAAPTKAQIIEKLEILRGKLIDKITELIDRPDPLASYRVNEQEYDYDSYYDFLNDQLQRTNEQLDRLGAPRIRWLGTERTRR